MCPTEFHDRPATYEVERPDDPERGVRVVCRRHGTDEEFPPGRRQVAFYCPDCGLELEVSVRPADDWRDWGERC